MKRKRWDAADVLLMGLICVIAIGLIVTIGLMPR